jgi:hypothetical protein
MVKEIGTTEALLSSISTLKDGSVKIAFELNPQNNEVINNLLNSYLKDQKLFTLGIVQSDYNRLKTDE